MGSIQFRFSTLINDSFSKAGKVFQSPSWAVFNSNSQLWSMTVFPRLWRCFKVCFCSRWLLLWCFLAVWCWVRAGRLISWLVWGWIFSLNPIRGGSAVFEQSCGVPAFPEVRRPTQWWFSWLFLQFDSVCELGLIVGTHLVGFLCTEGEIGQLHACSFGLAGSCNLRSS